MTFKRSASFSLRQLMLIVFAVALGLVVGCTEPFGLADGYFAARP